MRIYFLRRITVSCTWWDHWRGFMDWTEFSKGKNILRNETTTYISYADIITRPNNFKNYIIISILEPNYRNAHQTHYDTLKLRRSCTEKEIRDAFVKLSKEVQFRWGCVSPCLLIWFKKALISSDAKAASWMTVLPSLIFFSQAESIHFQVMKIWLSYPETIHWLLCFYSLYYPLLTYTYLQCHPDTSSSSNSKSTANFTRIMEAYKILSKRETRAEYDTALLNRVRMAMPNSIHRWDISKLKLTF